MREISPVRVHFSKDSIYYISSLKWPRDSADHESFSEEKSIAQRILGDSSRIKHVESWNACQLVGRDAKHVECANNASPWQKHLSLFQEVQGLCSSKISFAVPIAASLPLFVVNSFAISYVPKTSAHSCQRGYSYPCCRYSRHRKCIHVYCSQCLNILLSPKHSPLWLQLRQVGDG